MGVIEGIPIESRRSRLLELEASSSTTPPTQSAITAPDDSIEDLTVAPQALPLVVEDDAGAIVGGVTGSSAVLAGLGMTARWLYRRWRGGRGVDDEGNSGEDRASRCSSITPTPLETPTPPHSPEDSTDVPIGENAAEDSTDAPIEENAAVPVVGGVTGSAVMLAGASMAAHLVYTSLSYADQAGVVSETVPEVYVPVGEEESISVGVTGTAAALAGLGMAARWAFQRLGGYEDPCDGLM